MSTNHETDLPNLNEPAAVEREVRGLLDGIDEELAQHDMLPKGSEDEIAAAYLKIAQDTRYYLEGKAGLVIKDVGSADAHFAREIGINVAGSPDMLDILIDRAKAEYADESGQISLSDLVSAGKLIDIERMERRQTGEAFFYLLNRAVMEIDLQDLVETNRSRLRSVARELKGPIYGLLEESLLYDFIEGKAYPLDEVVMLMLEISDRHRREQTAIDRGDPAAIARRKQMLRHPEIKILGDEVAIFQEEEILPEAVPRPEENP